jgi:hypothetical protein
VSSTTSVFHLPILLAAESCVSNGLTFVTADVQTYILPQLAATRRPTAVTNDWCWLRSARISACRAARVRKLEASKVKKAPKRELIVVATMISRMIGNSVFSDRTDYSATTTRPCTSKMTR